MQFDWHNPYPSVRTPVFARNVVSTSQPLAAQAGLAVLRQGGNAVDAAIAAAAALAIVEPVSNGLGSDCFAMVWDGKQLHGLNASGTAPAAWSVDYFERKHGGVFPQRGWDAVTIPGCVAGWAALHLRFGALSFEDVLAPAVEYAERGFAVPPIVQQKWAAQVPVLQALPGFAEHFLPRGRAPAIGEHFVLRDAARSLRLIAQSKGRAFYEGEIAQRLADHARAHGGAQAPADWAGYAPEWVTPIAREFHGHTVHEIPPNGQGIAALMALGMLSHLDLAQYPVDSAESQHLQIEAMKLAFADAYRYVADARAMQVAPADLLDDAYLAERARLIDPARAQAFAPGRRPAGGTVYLATADERGMMVSFIQSNYMGFGSGIVVPDTGVSLHNRGHGFSLDRTHPNAVAGGKRPFHTIIPAFLTRNGEAQMSFGVMGGNMQPQGHLQTLVRMLVYGQQPQAACDAPRWKWNSGVTLDCEPAMAPGVVEALRQRGHVIEALDDPYMDFGSGQFIWRLGEPGVDGYVAASDSRRDGCAAGY
jgi:gamma-glutamyltranspeptidase/glutathione hydrolase